MKHYAVENDKDVDLSKLQADFMPIEDYEKAHKGLVIVCHDVILEYNGGALLVIRDNLPVKGILWPVGGRVNRGLNSEESLRKKVSEETSLEITDLEYLDTARTYFQEAPFNHERGTDSLNLMYFGKGKGEVKLDNLHSDIRIVRPEDYTEEFRAKLHPYTRDFMDLVINKIKKD